MVFEFRRRIRYLRVQDFGFFFRVWGLGLRVYRAPRAVAQKPSSEDRCRANSAHIRQSEPDSGPRLSGKRPENFSRSPLGWDAATPGNMRRAAKEPADRNESSFLCGPGKTKEDPGSARGCLGGAGQNLALPVLYVPYSLTWNESSVPGGTRLGEPSFSHLLGVRSLGFGV